MFKLASLFVEITAQDSALNRTLAGLKGRLADVARTRFSIPGGGLLTALGLGAGVAAISKSISGASDLAETVSKVGAVFGDQAGKVTSAADDMAKAFGIPKREFLDAASQFGLIAEGMGQTKTQAAEMSVKFAKLAADASSFYNVPVDVALEKIRAGLTGESEPLKAFGVIMDETTMKAYAVAHGLVKKGQELTNSAKLAARAALIEKGLATAQGDLAKTIDGTSNQARKFWGTLQNLGDTIGTLVLPPFTKFLALLNEVATDMSTSAQTGSGAWSGFAENFSSAIDVATSIYRNFGDIIERTGIMIGGSLQNAWEYLAYGGTVAGSVGKYIWESLVEAFDITLVAAANAKDNLISIFQEIWDYVTSGFKDPIEIKLKPLMEGIKLKGDGQFKMPELNLSSVENQLEEVDKRVREREAKRIADREGAGKKAGAGGGGAAGGGGGGGGGAASSAKVGITDADTYARELHEGALKAGDTQKDMLKEAQAQTKLLTNLDKNIAEAGPTRGGRGIAVFA